MTKKQDDKLNELVDKADDALDMDKINKDLSESMSKENNPNPEDAGHLAKELLMARRSNNRNKFILKLLFVTIVILFILGTVIAILAKDTWEKREEGDEILYGICQVSLGESRINGRRMFMRPYYEVLGIRLVDDNEMVETIYINNHYLDMIIVTMEGDNSFVTIMDDNKPSEVEIPVGDKYLFVLGEESEVVDHLDLCT